MRAKKKQRWVTVSNEEDEEDEEEEEDRKSSWKLDRYVHAMPLQCENAQKCCPVTQPAGSCV